MGLKDRFETGFTDVRVVDEVVDIAAGFNMVDWRATHQSVALTGTLRGLYSKLANNIDSPAGTITALELVPRTNENMNLGTLQGALINPIVKGSASDAVLTTLKGLHIKCETEEVRSTPTVSITNCYGLFVENDIKGGNTVVTGNHMGIVVNNFGTSCNMDAGIAVSSGDAAGGMDYGIDMNSALGEASVVNAAIRMDNGVCLLNGAGAPTDGVAGTGAGFAEKGSWYSDTTNGKFYVNGGTMASPAWKIVTSA